MKEKQQILYKTIQKWKKNSKFYIEQSKNGRKIANSI